VPVAIRPPDEPDVSVVVPLKDEERNVIPLYEELVAVLEQSGIRHEIVLVDDGSIDATFDRAVELHHRDLRVRVIRFSRNFGQTAAFAAGFAAARGRYVVTLDGDLQNDPADIPRMLQLAPDYEVVCGWRRNRKDALLTRKLPSVTANYLLGVVSGVRLHDNGCSLKVFRADIVKALRLRPGMHRYLPALASQLGARVTEVVVNHRPRRFGHSKYGLSRTFRVLADVVRLRTLMKQATETGEPVPPIYTVAARLG
jgi:glycosyltransferase involved in cell wall biosynthesis